VAIISTKCITIGIEERCDLNSGHVTAYLVS